MSREEYIAEEMGLQFCHISNAYSCASGTDCNTCKENLEYERELAAYYEKEEKETTND